MPFGFRLERVMDQPNIASIFYGPILLAVEEESALPNWRKVALDSGDLEGYLTGDPATLRFNLGPLKLKPFFRILQRTLLGLPRLAGGVTTSSNTPSPPQIPRNNVNQTPVFHHTMKTRIHKHLLAVSLLTALGQPLSAAPAVLAVDVGKPGHPVPATLWGIFFEDINLSADGGLYAELVRNRNFEDSDQPAHWTAIGSGAEAPVSAWTPPTC